MADLRLIQARCIAPAALLLSSGLLSPRATAWLCNSPAKRERCSEYSLKTDLSRGFVTASAAWRKPSCPSLSVSMRSLIVEIVSFCITIPTFRIRSAFCVHRSLRDLPPDVIFLMNKKGKDLTKEPPRSPKTRVGGYVILGRTIDKCRALLWGNIGEYHFDCPLDN